MLRSIKRFYGEKLQALDGDIGKVKDFYFDDKRWTVRYMVADTGSWLTDRQVLISPYAFRDIHQDNKILSVHLTRKQIEDSPTIDSHKPVHRQHEENHHSHYGIPFYWSGAGTWGMSNFPVPAQPAVHPPNTIPGTPEVSNTTVDHHLQSTLTVAGYAIKASNEVVGHISDFLMEESDWSIRHLVVNTRHWPSGKTILMPADCVHHVDCEEKTVTVKMSREAVLSSPTHEPV